MALKFRPYLSIDNMQTLRNILKNQNFIVENRYMYSKIEYSSKEEMLEEVKKYKNFYGFKAKEKIEEFIDDGLYHILMINYFRAKFLDFMSMYCYVANNTNDKNLDLNIDQLETYLNGYINNPKIFISLYYEELNDLSEYMTKLNEKSSFNISGIDIDTLRNDTLHSFYKVVNKLIYLLIMFITSKVKDYKLNALFLNASESRIKDDQKIYETSKYLTIFQQILAEEL